MKTFDMFSTEGEMLVKRVVDAAIKMKTDLEADFADVSGFVEINLMKLSVAGYPEAVEANTRDRVYQVIKAN